MKVLLVDDEPRYRAALEAVLVRAGHDVRSAGCGREAIDMGVGIQPDLLISDWMLQNHLHGLQVCEALQILFPSMQTILMTGYPSDDLRADAARIGITGFIEKPFATELLLEAIERCASSRRLRSANPYGLVELEPGGAIRYATPTAQRLLSQIPGGATATSVAELFHEAEAFETEAFQRWTRVVARDEAATPFWVRASQTGQHRIAALLRGDDARPTADASLQMLLAIEEPRQLSWDRDDRVLVLDRDAEVRDMVVSQLQRVGCICYKAESPEIAIDLLRADPLIRVVVIDRGSITAMPIGKLTHRLQMIRSGLRIVGSSDNPRDQSDFASHGIHRFVDKPWRTGDLIDVLRD